MPQIDSVRHLLCRVTWNKHVQYHQGQTIIILLIIFHFIIILFYFILFSGTQAILGKVTRHTLSTLYDSSLLFFRINVTEKKF